MLVQDEQQFNAALDMLKRAQIIAIDTETYGVKGQPVRHPAQGNRLIGISTHCVLPDDTGYAMSFYFPFRHSYEEKTLNLFTTSENLPIEWLPRFAEVLNRPDVYLKFWHRKFDLQIFRADNLILDANLDHFDDGIVKAQLINETMSHRLKDVGALIFGDHVRDEEKKLDEIVRKQGGYHKTTPQQMERYACQDAELTHNVDPILDKELQRQQLTHLVPREIKFQTCLMEMEWEGINFDRPLAEQLSKASRLRMRQLEDELGFDPQKKNQLAHRLFADYLEQEGPDDPPYLPDRFELTKTKSQEFPMGVPKMDEKTLVELRNPTADLVLEYRGLGKANSTWYDGWIRRLGNDGRIHPTYNHSDKKAKFGTVTSRLSSFIQQMPRDPDAMVKLLLKPDQDDHILVEFDYAQIEYREAASYANDEVLIEQFRNGEDTHLHLANEIGVDRQSAKQTAYTILYGGQGKALAINLEKQVWQNEKRIIHVTEEEGQRIVDAYYRVHPKIREVSRQAARLARLNGYVELWNGRKRHFSPDEPWEFRKAFNSVLQGGAAQIICESMLRFHDMRDQYPFRMRVQVHDSLWFSIPLDGFDDYVKVIVETMEWPGAVFPVPFPVDWKVIRGAELREDQLSGSLLGTRSG